MEIEINTLTPELFLDLYKSVGWEPPCIEQVRAALECLRWLDKMRQIGIKDG